MTPMQIPVQWHVKRVFRLAFIALAFHLVLNVLLILGYTTHNAYHHVSVPIIMRQMGTVKLVNHLAQHVQL